jgi:phosphoglycerol transferase
MIFSALAALILITAVFAYRKFTGARWLRAVLATSVAVTAILLALWFGMNAITGAGINDSVFYHMATGLGGGDVSQYAGMIALGVAAVLAVFFGCYQLYRRLPGAIAPKRWGNVLVMGLVAASFGANPFMHDITRHYTREYLTVQQTEGFIDPVLGAVPAKKKNLILLYLESTERSYFDEVQFPGLIEDLRPIEAQAQSFTGLGQSIGAGFTIGGMVASQCGVPLLISGTENSMQVSNFLTGATCLGDLLKQSGYRTEYFGGASKEFAGKGSFYESHSFDQVTGLEDLKPTLEDPAYLGPWGLQDDTLFALATKKLETLAQGPDPFAMVMLTLDTHHPDGHGNTNRSCQDVVYGDGSNAMLTSVKCEDKLAAAFIKSIQASPYAKDTVIVVMSDHLAMVNGASSELAQVDRNNLFMILNADAKPALIARKGSTLDVGPTIMAALGFDVPQMGFGVNLLGKQQTLAEKMPEGALRTDLFADYLMGFQKVYARLWDYPKIADGFYVNLEASEVQFGPASFKVPALMRVGATGDLEDVTIADPLSDKTLAGMALGLPGDAPLLWIDACATLAPLAKAEVTAGLCLGTGALGAADFAVKPLVKSDFVARDGLALAAGVVDQTLLDGRKASLRAGLVASGALPTDAAMNSLSYVGRDILIRSAASEQGASFVRLLTVDSLDSGADLLLGRGISLIGIAPDGRTDLLGYLDSCEPKAEAAPANFQAIIREAGPAFSAYAVVSHDSAICDAGRTALDAAVAGLELPKLQELGFRQPYAAFIRPDGVIDEMLGVAGSKLLIHYHKGGVEVAAQVPVVAEAPAPETVATSPATAVAAAIAPETETPVMVVPVVAPAANAAALLAEAKAVCALPTAAALPDSTPTPMEAGRTYALTNDLADTDLQFKVGWWEAEDFGIWIGANRAEISLTLPKGATQRLEIAGVPYGMPEISVELWAGKKTVGTAILADGKVAVFDLAALPKGQPLDLTLVFSGDLRCPAVLEKSTDVRSLVAMIRSIKLNVDAVKSVAELAEACQEPAIAKLAGPTAPLDLKAPNLISDAASGTVGFGNGWWAEEPFGRWIGAGYAEVAVILPESDTELDLLISGKTYAAGDLPLEVRYMDKLLVAGDFGADKLIVVPTNTLPRGVPAVLTLHFAQEVAACPKSRGESDDLRRLVALIEGLTLRKTTAKPQKAAATGPLPSVAHAGGAIGNESVTDSIEALETNAMFYERFEIDLSWTSDRQLVCLHDWKDSFSHRFGYDAKDPVSLAEFEKLLGDGKLQNCTLATLAAWMKEHPEKRVLTDVKEANLEGLALIGKTYPKLRDQFIPQAYQPEEIAQIKALGFKDVIWTLYRYDGDEAAVIAQLQANPVLALTMNEDRAATGLALRVKDATGVQSYVHTVNDAAKAACFANLGIAGVYTDSLRGLFPSQKGTASDTCVGLNG